MKKNNKLIFVVVVIVAALFLMSALSDRDATSLTLSTSPEDPSSLVAGPNTVRSNVVLPASEEFSGDAFIKESWLANNLFSFRDVQKDDSGASCGKVRDAPVYYGLTSDNLIEPVAHCNDGEFVNFFWGPSNPWNGPAGGFMFNELWEKTSDEAMFHFSGYWLGDPSNNYVDQGYTYSYACYSCNDPSDTLSCADTDGDSKSTVGRVHVVSSGESAGYAIDTWYIDYCTDSSNNVVEYTCGSNGDVDADEKVCWYGCEAGRCKSWSGEGSETTEQFSCFENDNGKDYDSFSTTTVFEGIYTRFQDSDWCDGDTLNEYYCATGISESITLDTYDCPNGCDQGRCLSSGETTTTEEDPEEEEEESYLPCVTMSCVSGKPTCKDSNGDYGTSFTCATGTTCEDSSNSAACTVDNPEPTPTVPEEELVVVELVCGDISGTTDKYVVELMSDDYYGETITDCYSRDQICSGGTCVPAGSEDLECSSNSGCSGEKDLCNTNGVCVECLGQNDCFVFGSVNECVAGVCLSQGPTPTPTPTPSPIDDEEDNSLLIIGAVAVGIGGLIYFTRFHKPKKKKTSFFKKKTSKRRYK